MTSLNWIGVCYLNMENRSLFPLKHSIRQSHLQVADYGKKGENMEHIRIRILISIH